MATTTTPQRMAYSVDEAAAACGCSRAFLYQLVMSGELVSAKVAGRRFIRAEALEAFLREREQ